MSNPRAPSLPLVRAAAVVLSLGLGLAVVVNAQFGCDAPSKAPPADVEEASKAAPATKVEAANTEAAVTEPAKAEPAAKVEPAATPEAAAKAEPAANAAGKGSANANPVLMPASKSGGDFGAMRFPGQKGTTGEAHDEQAPNQAPAQQQAPTQQANHGG